MKKAILSCEKLSIGYKKTLKSNISFKLNEGEVIYLQGNNGSGKTTLIKTILEEIKPKKGSVDWGILNNEVSYLPQLTNSEAHFSYNIEEILDIYKVSNQLKNLLSPGLLSLKWTELSGGEKQKTMILSKIKEGTKLLILDEPFNHLDTKSINLVVKLLCDLIKTKKIKSLLLVSHLKVDIGELKLQEILL